MENKPDEAEKMKKAYKNFKFLYDNFSESSISMKTECRCGDDCSNEEKERLKREDPFYNFYESIQGLDTEKLKDMLKEYGFDNLT